MRVASIAEVKSKFSEYIRRSEENPIVITKNGKPTAVIINVSDNDDDLERILLAHNPKLKHLLSEAKKRITETGGLSHDEVWS